MATIHEKLFHNFLRAPWVGIRGILEQPRPTHLEIARRLKLAQAITQTGRQTPQLGTLGRNAPSFWVRAPSLQRRPAFQRRPQLKQSDCPHSIIADLQTQLPRAYAIAGKLHFPSQRFHGSLTQ